MKIPFSEVFADETKNGTKLKTSDYQTSGTHPIIDQGQDFIAGYTDSDNGLYTDVPAIIFGDHTRVLKYVDFPFFLGADGAKILKARSAHANYKYLYYALKSVRIPDTGYNRHFKWLKEAAISIPGSQKQESIVFTLDSISRIISHRKSQLAKLDELVKCRFVEMFGDPVTNPKQFPCFMLGEIVKFQGGSQPDKKHFEYESSPHNIRLLQIRDYKSDRFVTYIPKALAKRFCSADDIMIGRYGPPIFQILGGIEGAYNVALMKAIPQRGNKEFIRQFLKQDCLLKYLEGLSKRTAGQDGIQMDKLKSYPFPYPPDKLQDAFAAFVSRIDKLRIIGKRGRQKA